MNRQTLTVIVPCFNEEGNVNEIYGQVEKVLSGVDNLEWKIQFIDNASEDLTVEKIRELARRDFRVSAIINSRNFGHLRSPYHALLEAKSDAMVIMAADLQDPPDLLPEFIAKWREGFRVVMGVKTTSEESRGMFFLRKAYYRMLASLSEVPVVKGFHGYGLLDREVVNNMRRFKSPLPYLRGLVSEVGFPAATIEYRQPIRRRGKSKNNLLSLVDAALLGLVTHSRVPLRVAIFLGAILGAASAVVGLGYFIYKLFYWNEFSLGLAPLVIGFFIFSSIQLLFLGLIGEYLSAVLNQVKDHPLVVEQERINC